MATPTKPSDADLDAARKAIYQAVKDQYPKSWLDAPTVQAKGPYYPVIVELPLSAVQTLRQAVEYDDYQAAQVRAYQPYLV